MFRCFKKVSWVWFTLCMFLCVSCNSEQKQGNEALRMGDYDRAIQKFSQVLDADPADRDARYGIALAYFGKAEASEKIGQPSIDLWIKTQPEFRIVQKIDSTVARAMHSTALFYLARAKVMENSQAKVLGMLNESIELDSTNDFSLNLKGLVLQGMGDEEAAQKIFTDILSKNPNFAPAYSNLGNLYWEQGKIEEAWDIWSMGSIQFPKNSHLKRWTKIAEDRLKSNVLEAEGKNP